MIRRLPLALALLAAAMPVAGVVAPSPASAVMPVSPVQLPHMSVYDIGRRDGPVIVLIPGLASPRAVWDRVVPGLLETHRVLVVQINGFDGGDPRANLSPGIVDGVIADLHGYLVDRKLARVKLVGHSLGGLIALKYARDRPSDVSQAMLVDALPYVGLIFAPGATVPMLEPTAKAMAAKIAASYGKPADMAAQTVTAQRLALKPRSVATVAGWGAKADPRVVAQAFYEDMTIDLRPDLARIAVPVTLVYPTSTVAPKAVVDSLYRGSFAGLPHIRYVEIADSAHFVMLDQPKAFAAALTAFAAE